MTDSAFQLGITLLLFGGFLANIDFLGETGVFFGLASMLLGFAVAVLGAVSE